MAQAHQTSWCTALLVPLLLSLSAAPGAAHPPAAGPDLERERRMSAEIVDVILEGEPLELRGDDGQTFLGIYTESAEPAARGTVILLHGRGLHPDWANVAHPLRVGLTHHGWNTLSIQLPVLDKNAKYFDYFKIFGAAIPRIEAAIAKAQELSAGRIVIVAHSCGAHMAQHWIHVRGRQALDRMDAFVGIGMGATDFQQPMREPFALDKITAPILDLYAADDFSAVHRLAPRRLAAMRRGGNVKNAQVVVADADHYFTDRGDALLDALSAWLDTL